MEKYNDFAMPSLENIEQMAKAFKDKELKRKEIEIGSFFKSKEQAQDFYFNVSNLCAIADFLFSKFNKNDQVKEIFEKCKKIKLLVDGMVLDLGLEEVKDFAVAENTAIQDVCSFCSKCLRVCFEREKIEELALLAMEFLDVIENICKY